MPCCFSAIQNAPPAKRPRPGWKTRAWTISCGTSRPKNPTQEELRQWHAQSGLPLKRFFNTSGQQYRALGLKDRLPHMTQEEQLALLASDGMLVKRPILLDGDKVLVGFRQGEWEAALL